MFGMLKSTRSRHVPAPDPHSETLRQFISAVVGSPLSFEEAQVADSCSGKLARALREQGYTVRHDEGGGNPLQYLLVIVDGKHYEVILDRTRKFTVGRIS